MSMDIAPFYAGSDEELEFEVKDRDGQVLPDGTTVRLTVDGIGEFETHVVTGKVRYRLEETDTAPFKTGVHPYYLVAIDGDDTGVCLSGNIVSTLLPVPAEEGGES